MRPDLDEAVVVRAARPLPARVRPVGAGAARMIQGGRLPVVPAVNVPF